MPITGQGWEMLIVRRSEQERVVHMANGKTRRRRRTIGTYKVFHDGTAVASLSGTTAEARGPGDNSKENNGLRIEAGTYPLWTSDGPNYLTLGYDTRPVKYPRPGVELRNTNKRTDILFHPGHGFLASIGCINLCTRLPNSSEDIDLKGSHERVVSVIDDMKAYLGKAFPKANGKRIGNASIIVEGEP